MAEGGIEEAVEKIVQKTTTRRSLLRLGARAAAAGAITATIGLPERTNDDHLNHANTTPIPEATQNHPPHESPKELPQDILGEGELESANIRIGQADKVKIYLRKSVFQFPLFKDAKDGKLDEVVIVLSDYRNLLNAKASHTFPQDAKLLWKSLDYVSDENQYGINGTLINAEVLNDLSPDFIKSHPEYARKIYIFLGAEAVKPTDSLPDPQWIEQYSRLHYLKSDTDLEKTYHFYPRTKLDTGFALRHEVSHYKSDPKQGERSFNPEGKTDAIAFKGIKEAWRKYQETGDTSGYPFVFVTEKGITITKNQKLSTPETV